MVLASDHKCNPKHGIRDSEKNWISTLLTIAAIAAAGYSAYKAYDLAQTEWNMAMKYYDISKWWLDYYNQYFAPLEDKTIEEAMDIEYVEPSYVAARGRARASAWIAFKNRLRENMRCTSRYCTGLRNDMLMTVARAEATAVSLADGLGYRNERAYVEARNDALFKRKIETAKLGRNIMSEASSLAKAPANIYGDLLDQTWAGLEGAGSYLGYMDNRNVTHYPSMYLDNGTEVYNRDVRRRGVSDTQIDYYDAGTGGTKKGSVLPDVTKGEVAASVYN